MGNWMKAVYLDLITDRENIDYTKITEAEAEILWRDILTDVTAIDSSKDVDFEHTFESSFYKLIAFSKGYTEEEVISLTKDMDEDDAWEYEYDLIWKPIKEEFGFY